MHSTALADRPAGHLGGRPERSELVLLTEPVVFNSAKWRRDLIARTLGQFLPRSRRPPIPERFGGHYGVTRSVLVGLRKLDITYLYNPPLDDLKADVAVVLASPQAVEQAVGWKARGGCRKLYAGPNIAVLPDGDGEILRSPLIDRVIVPSDWVRESYVAEAPELADKIVIHTVGIDEAYWSPQIPRSSRRDVLIYDKMMRPLADDVARSLDEVGLASKVIRYGAYAPQEYRHALDHAFVCIVLSESESQGIALAEAWAMDVPTLVLHRERRLINGRNLRISTAPYLSPSTGRFWTGLEELPALLRSFDATAFSPRAWVLENMTDRLAAESLLRIVSSR